MNHCRRSLILLTLLLAGAFIVTPAFGSQIVGHDATHPTLAIDHQGRAHVTYFSAGQKVRLVASGAINARPTSTVRPQVKFRLRYRVGGRGVCLPYDGPRLAWLVKACRSPDGSYWALQAWQRLKPNYGGTTGSWELHLSHWRGPLAQLVIYQNWAHGTYRQIFGRLTYRGRGVYGLKATPAGAPLDSYGRNIYLDTFDSAYGSGWHRENGFLTHHNGHTLGDFCYGFYPHGGHPSGRGTRYRATVEGPGVTPDVMWTAIDIGPYEPSMRRRMEALELSWGDPKCQA